MSWKFEETVVKTVIVRSSDHSPVISAVTRKVYPTASNIKRLRKKQDFDAFDLIGMKLFNQIFSCFLVALGIFSRLKPVFCQTYTGVFAGTGICDWNDDGMIIRSGDGDEGPATSATVYNPYGVWGDSNGNMYIAELSFARVRVVDKAGIISTIVGTGSISNTGAGGPGTSTSLDYAWYLCGDASGSNLYIAGNFFTWQYSFLTLQVNTFIGASAAYGFGGDGGPATSALMHEVLGLAVSRTTLYAADYGNCLVRAVDLATNIISTYVGKSCGFGGDGGYAAAASLNRPYGIWLDSNDNLYIADTYNYRVRLVSSSAIISTFAGTGSSSLGGDAMAATSSSLGYPVGVTGDSIGNVYIAESFGCRIRVVQKGIITTVIGAGTCGYAGTAVQLASSTMISGVFSLWISTSGVLYLAESGNCLVRYVDLNYPTLTPTPPPSFSPTFSPSRLPTYFPTTAPSFAPTFMPSIVPTCSPSAAPTYIPTFTPTAVPSASPTAIPSFRPSYVPSVSPTFIPTAVPTFSPTVIPTFIPTYYPTVQPTSQPSAQPTTQPSGQPSCRPSAQPSGQPTAQPSRQPTRQPSSRPSSQPTSQPSRQPSSQPTGQPSLQPTTQPSTHPSSQPSSKPTSQPSRQPSSRPTSQPSGQPSGQPSIQPSAQPSVRPSAQPSSQPTSQPSSQPSMQPTAQPTGRPSSQPSSRPSSQPTSQPSSQPSSKPSSQPTSQPSMQPTSQPTVQPSAKPTSQPSSQPSSQPTEQPSSKPSSQPSGQPSSRPSAQPSVLPSSQPSSQPTSQPSSQPSDQPSIHPTSQPSGKPSSQPSSQPSAQPSAQPSIQPTVQPSSQPSSQPTGIPSAQPTTQPTSDPTNQPSPQPSSLPTTQPSAFPSSTPTSQPSSFPSSRPSCQPSSLPTGQPSLRPSSIPTSQPSCEPSSQPTALPSTQPSSIPTNQPSAVPSFQPTSSPSAQPSSLPSSCPSSQPTSIPSRQPTSLPSSLPSRQPTSSPSMRPTGSPSSQPSCQPSSVPSAIPSARPSSRPSTQPSTRPSSCPSVQPSSLPTSQPSGSPSSLPSAIPSNQPSSLPTSQPSSFPSGKPSSIPSADPTLQPTGIPTRSPSTQPTSSPSDLPSSHPSSRPSSIPTNSPTSLPSQIPTSRPSNQPSSDPSQQPISSPTSLPSAQPVSNPTFQPSAAPSLDPNPLHPTRKPVTSSPTLSLVSQWNLKLQQSTNSLSVNDDSSIVQRSTLLQRWNWLDPNSGECSAWLSYLSPQLSILKANYIPSTVTWTSVTSPVVGFVNQTYSCKSAGNMTKIIDTLLIAASGDLFNAVNVVCNGNVWKIGKCQDGKPSLCVNCKDLCSSPASPQVFAPCASNSMTASTSFELLSISWILPPGAPKVISRSFVANQTSISISLVLSNEGITRFGVFAASADVPSSSSLVLLQNLASTSVNNRTAISITGLEPATDYVVYILASSLEGVDMTFNDMLSTKLAVRTLCCRSIVIQLSSSRLAEGQSVNGFLRASISGSMQSSLMIQPVLYQKQQSGNLKLVQPTGWVTPSAATLSTLVSASSFSMLSLSAGDYAVGLIVQGVDASKYVVQAQGRSYNSNSTLAAFSVIDLSVAMLPAPVLLSATFTGDGSYIILNFDSSTNYGGMSLNFVCGDLFSFACAENSRCQWVDQKTVYAYVRSLDGCAKVGDSFSIRNSTSIKATCPLSRCSNYDAWPVIESITILISAPSLPLLPIVAITMPSTLGQCSPLTIDFTSSRGNGGRSWQSVEISVESSRNTSILQEYLRSQQNKGSVVTVPAAFIDPDQNYNYVVKLCNFLGSCGQSSKRVSVIAMVLPTVSISGSSLRSLQVNQALSLTTNAALTNCDTSGTQGVVNFVYRWTVSLGTTALSLTSSSNNPARFTLPAYSLTSGMLYTITVMVTTPSGSSSSASAQVSVTSGKIVAVLSGGLSDRLAKAGDYLNMDGSNSYDENMQNVVGAAAGLSFSWSCMQLLPTINNTCDMIFDGLDIERQANNEVIVLRSLVSTAGFQAQLQLRVTDSANTRSSSLIVKILILPADAASISLQSSAASNVINVGQVLQIAAVVSLPSSSSLQKGNCSWSLLQSPDVSLEEIALTPASTIATQPQSTLYLKVSTLMLSGGFSYTFQLTVTLPTVSGTVIESSNSISVAVNLPPQPGRCNVDPKRGKELSDLFTLSCSQWVDDNLPLQYQFSYLTSVGNVVTVSTISEVSYISVMLPAGQKTSDYNVTTLALIFDSYLANSTNFLFLKVEERMLNTSQATQLLNQSFAAFESSNVDAIKQSAGVASYLLNKVNCSSAPDCTSLNRQACQRVSQTCGPCLSEAYVGIEGDSNEACMSIESRRHLDTVLESGRDTKSCVAHCSGHGQCIFQSVVTGLEVVDCESSDLSCRAVCKCDVGYSYSAICDVSEEEGEANVLNREKLLEGITALTRLEDVSPQSIEGWINSVNDATHVSRQLSDESVSQTLTFVNGIIQATQEWSLSDSVSLSSLVDALDSASSALQLNNEMKTRRRKRALSERGTASVVSLQSTLSNFTSLLVSTMVPGESAVTAAKSNMRIHLEAVDASETENGNCSSSREVTLPLTTLESYLGKVATRVIVPTCRTNSNVSSNFQIVASTLSNGLYNQEYDSDPLSLVLSSIPCSTISHSCEVQLVLSRDLGSNQTFPANPSRIYNVTCLEGDFSVHRFHCGDGKNYTTSCQGKREIIQSRCPVIRHEPTCNLVQGGILAEKNCKMLSFTNDTVTCSCKIIPKIGSRRFLSQTGNNGTDSQLSSGQVHVSYVSMMQAVAGNFENTVLSAGSLNDGVIERGWIALTIIGSLSGCIVLALILAYQADRQESSKDAASKMKDTTKGILVKQKGIRGNALSAASKSESNSILKLAEESLPQILGSKSVLTKVSNEMKINHRWFGVVFHYSQKFPRVLRVVSLATNIVIMLFVQSLTYDLTNGNDGTCERLTSRTDCLEPRSPYATGTSKCYWTVDKASSSSISVNPELDGSCAYLQPDNSMEVVIFVAIFSALVSTPFALMIDRILIQILAAPAISLSKKNLKTSMKVVDAYTLDKATSIVPRAQMKVKIEERQRNEKGQKMLMMTALDKFSKLTLELKEYRDLIENANEKAEFDALWGLDKTGNYKQQHTEDGSSNRSSIRKVFDRVSSVLKRKEGSPTIGDLIVSELESVERALKEEKERLEKDKMSEKEKGKRLLYLFQKDLMPGINGMILESKDKRDNVNLKGSSRSAKLISWLFLGSVNVGMLFYILLFALSQDSHRQGAWGQSFALWLIVEIFLVSSLSVMIMHVWIPSVVMRDLGSIKKKLIGNVISFYQNMSKGEQAMIMKQKVFNSAEYLFVSYRLSLDYSDLKIAKMILAFQTPWPKRSYQHVQDVSKKYDRKFAALSRSFSMVVLFFLSSLLSVPISVQDMIIQMVSTTAMGYTLLLHLQLYKIFPILVLIPALFIAGLLHFLIQSNKAKQRIEQMKLLKEVGSINEQRNPQAKEVAVEALQETIKLEEKKMDDSASKFVHKKRRESIQQGISLAKKLDRLIYQSRRDSNASMNSADYDLSSIDSHLSSAVEGEEKRAYDRFDAHKNAESGSGENSIAFSSSSDDSVNEIQKHRNAFANLTKTFQRGDQIAPAPVEIENVGDDDDDDDQLYNLHLALDINDSSSATNSHDSLANELRKEVNQTWQVVSLSNSSLASKFLGLVDTRHRSYELQDLPPNDELEDEKDDTSSILLHEQKEEDNDDDFSSLTHTNMDFPLTNSLKTKMNVLKMNEGSSNSFDDISSIRLPVSEVSGSSFVSSLNPLKVRFPRPGISLLEYLTSRRSETVAEDGEFDDSNDLADEEEAPTAADNRRSIPVEEKNNGNEEEDDDDDDGSNVEQVEVDDDIYSSSDSSNEYHSQRQFSTENLLTSNRGMIVFDDESDEDDDLMNLHLAKKNNQSMNVLQSIILRERIRE